MNSRVSVRGAGTQADKSLHRPLSLLDAQCADFVLSVLNMDRSNPRQRRDEPGHSEGLRRAGCGWPNDLAGGDPGIVLARDCGLHCEPTTDELDADNTINK